MANVRRSRRLRRPVASRRPAVAPKARTIKEHNKRIRWFKEQRVIHAAFNALVYDVRGTRPRLLLVPSRLGWDPACGCPAYPDDLDYGDWFSGGRASSPIDYFPETRCRLANGYDIIAVPRREQRLSTTPLNATLRRLFGLDWPGALVVVKRARRHRGRAMHITPPEVSLINVFVERWIQTRLSSA